VSNAGFPNKGGLCQSKKSMRVISILFSFILFYPPGLQIGMISNLSPFNDINLGYLLFLAYLAIPTFDISKTLILCSFKVQITPLIKCALDVLFKVSKYKSLGVLFALSDSLIIAYFNISGLISDPS
jgi:hypothetical protein